jgi:CubicO group peptidase (beta-lactamase class C family)
MKHCKSRTGLRHLLAGIAGLALAATAAPDEIDEFVRATMAREKTPGLVLAIATGTEGSPVRAYGAVRTYGMANLEHDVSVRPTTVFQSGSTGKQFTAAAVLLQVEDGKLRLDDSIARYFPSDRASWRAISVRHLLTHTSGLPDYTGEDDAGIDLRRDYTEEELVQWAMRLEPQFVAGTRWAYSNTGYVVLGALVRKVSGEFYGEVLAKRVFAPAGMAGARVISEADLVPHRAAGYELIDGAVRNQSWVAPKLNTTADGALYLTARDFLAWDAALRQRKLLAAESYREQWTPVRLADGHTWPYGFGWFIAEQRGSPNLEHGGSWQGFRAHIARYVERGLSLVVLCNLDKCDATSIVHGVAGLIDPTLRLPDPRRAAEDPDQQRTRNLRAALEAWANAGTHPLMAPGFVARLDPGARSDATRKEVKAQIKDSIAFHFLAEDDVRTRALMRNGGAVSRIAYCGLMTAQDATGFRFYLDERGSLLDVHVEGW